MWIFTSGGALMPSIAPLNKADKKYTLGYRDIQIRARVRSHLENFIRDFMEPWDLDYSDIEATDDMDYDFRVYTTKSAFAMAMSLAIHAIDYTSFKDTATDRDENGRLLYIDGVKYKEALMGVWSRMSQLGNPYGGRWGYGETWRQSSWGKGKYDETKGYKPTSFGPATPKPDTKSANETRPSAAALAQAGIADPERVLARWEEMDAEDAREAERATDSWEMYDPAERADYYADYWAEQGMTVFDPSDADDEAYDEDDKIVDLADALERSWSSGYNAGKRSADDRPMYTHRTAKQILSIAENLPEALWKDVFVKDEMEYLATQEIGAHLNADQNTGEVIEDAEVVEANTSEPLTGEEVEAAIQEITVSADEPEAAPQAEAETATQ